MRPFNFLTVFSIALLLSVGCGHEEGATQPGPVPSAPSAAPQSDPEKTALLAVGEKISTALLRSKPKLVEAVGIVESVMLNIRAAGLLGEFQTLVIVRDSLEANIQQIELSRNGTRLSCADSVTVINGKNKELSALMYNVRQNALSSVESITRVIGTLVSQANGATIESQTLSRAATALADIAKFLKEIPSASDFGLGTC